MTCALSGVTSLSTLRLTRASFLHFLHFLHLDHYCREQAQRHCTGKMVMLRLTAEQYRKLPILANDSTCSGKTYIVTGSNSGLGLETARHLVEFSASRVVLAVRNITAGENAKKDIEKSTGRKGVIQVGTRQDSQ